MRGGTRPLRRFIFRRFVFRPSPARRRDDALDRSGRPRTGHSRRRSRAHSPRRRRRSRGPSRVRSRRTHRGVDRSVSPIDRWRVGVARAFARVRASEEVGSVEHRAPPRSVSKALRTRQTHRRGVGGRDGAGGNVRGDVSGQTGRGRTGRRRSGRSSTRLQGEHLLEDRTRPGTRFPTTDETGNDDSTTHFFLARSTATTTPTTTTPWYTDPVPRASSSDVPPPTQVRDRASLAERTDASDPLDGGFDPKRRGAAGAKRADLGARFAAAAAASAPANPAASLLEEVRAVVGEERGLPRPARPHLVRALGQLGGFRESTADGDGNGNDVAIANENLRGATPPSSSARSRRLERERTETRALVSAAVRGAATCLVTLGRPANGSTPSDATYSADAIDLAPASSVRTGRIPIGVAWRTRCWTRSVPPRDGTGASDSRTSRPFARCSPGVCSPRRRIPPRRRSTSDRRVLAWRFGSRTYSEYHRPRRSIRARPPRSPKPSFAPSRTAAKTATKESSKSATTESSKTAMTESSRPRHRPTTPNPIPNASSSSIVSFVAPRLSRGRGG